MPSTGRAQFPFGSGAVGCRLRHETRVELEREKEQLEDDFLAFLEKIDQMQKTIDEMTLKENRDAEFIAKVMKERDRVLAEKEQHS